MLASRPCVHLGQLSYSWYLWHWPLLAIARGEASAERSFLRDGALATVALLLAELTYRFVENPIRFGRPGPFRVTSRTLWSGLALSLLMAASAGLLRFIADARERDAASAMGPGLARGDLSPMNPGCNGFVDRATCTRGDFGRVPGIVVWGDSHAARMVSLAVAFGAESGLPVLQRSFNACPPLRNVLPTQVEGRANVACGGFNRSVEAEIAELARAGQVRGVILEARWPNYLAPGQGRGGLPRRLVVGRRVLDRIGSLRALKDGLGQRLDVLHELGVRVLLMAPLPEYPWRVPQCVLARGVKPCRISRARAEDDRRAAVEALREVAAGRPDVRLFDGIDAFCGTEWCDPAPGGEVALADEHHLTFRAAAGLLPRARADLRWLAGG
jgi:hypothetical protein